MRRIDPSSSSSFTSSSLSTSSSSSSSLLPHPQNLSSIPSGPRPHPHPLAPTTISFSLHPSHVNAISSVHSNSNSPSHVNVLESSLSSYLEYHSIVGDADGGTLFSDSEYETFKREMTRRRKENRLYVFWRNLLSGMDCKSIGPFSKCFCGHSYKNHNSDWEGNGDITITIPCRQSSCLCSNFNYIPIHGTQDMKCSTCRHSHTDHNPNGKQKCLRNFCPSQCQQFTTAFSCSCGALCSDHFTIIQLRSQRENEGREVDNLGFGGEGVEAQGGITSFLSLADGIDRDQWREEERRRMRERQKSGNVTLLVDDQKKKSPSLPPTETSPSSSPTPSPSPSPSSSPLDFYQKEKISNLKQKISHPTKAETRTQNPQIPKNPNQNHSETTRKERPNPYQQTKIQTKTKTRITKANFSVHSPSPFSPPPLSPPPFLPISLLSTGDAFSDAQKIQSLRRGKISEEDEMKLYEKNYQSSRKNYTQNLKIQR